jgi:hypothetical protein
VTSPASQVMPYQLLLLPLQADTPCQLSSTPGGAVMLALHCSRAAVLPSTGWPHDCNAGRQAGTEDNIAPEAQFSPAKKASNQNVGYKVGKCTSHNPTLHAVRSVPGASTRLYPPMLVPALSVQGALAGKAPHRPGAPATTRHARLPAWGGSSPVSPVRLTSRERNMELAGQGGIVDFMSGLLLRSSSTREGMPRSTAGSEHKRADWNQWALNLKMSGSRVCGEVAGDC